MNLALLSIGVLGFGLYKLMRETDASIRQDERDALEVLYRDRPTPSDVTPFVPRPAKPTLDALYRKYGERHGIDWRLLKAIAIQESSENVSAIGGMGEVGLMQVLCIPDASGYCTAKFNVQDWGPPKAVELEDADYNLHIATQILRWNLDYAGGDMREALAIYNGGLENPQYGYAAQVLGRYAGLGGSQAIV